MNKEVFLAILAGSLFGLLVAFGVWRANSYLNSKTPNSEPSKQTVQDKTTQLKIAIAKPDNFEVITSSPTNISGLVKPQSFVVVSGEEDDELQVATDSGTFEVPLELSGGANQVKLASFDMSENSIETDLLLVFSTEFQKETTTDASISTATEDAVRKKVQEKLDKVTQRGTSYLGIVTDLPDDTIQIKNLKGEIQQISINPTTTVFIKSTATTSKVIKKNDLAIGDFVVAMGTKNANGVLESSRVLVTDTLTASKRKILIGKVSDLTKNTFNLKTKSGQTFAASLSTDGVSVFKLQNGKTVLSKFVNLTNDSLVIVAGEVTENKLTARNIWIVTSK